MVLLWLFASVSFQLWVVFCVSFGLLVCGWRVFVVLRLVCCFVSGFGFVIYCFGTCLWLVWFVCNLYDLMGLWWYSLVWVAFDCVVFDCCVWI